MIKAHQTEEMFGLMQAGSPRDTLTQMVISVTQVIKALRRLEMAVDQILTECAGLTQHCTTQLTAYTRRCLVSATLHFSHFM